MNGHGRNLSWWSWCTRRSILSLANTKYAWNAMSLPRRTGKTWRTCRTGNLSAYALLVSTNISTHPAGPVGPGGAGAPGGPGGPGGLQISQQTNSQFHKATSTHPGGPGTGGAGAGAGGGGAEPHLAASCASDKTSPGIAMPYPAHWLCTSGIMLPTKASAPLSLLHFPQRSPTTFNRKPGCIAEAHSSAIVLVIDVCR